MNIIKIGGSAGIDLDATLANLANRIHNGETWIIVHGASAEATALGQRRGVPPQWLHFPDGSRSRYNDAETIAIFEQAAHTVSERIAKRLMASGIATTPVWAGVRGHRKQAIRAVRSGRPVVVRDDYSGLIGEPFTGLLNGLLENARTPVVPPLAHSPQGDALNVDGDLVAAAVSRALGADTLLLLTNVPGLLRDVDNPASLIHNVAELEAVRDVAQGRMRRKLQAAERANARRVIIAQGCGESPVDTALSGGGTHIRREVSHA